MNDYERRQEERKQRYLDKADDLRTEAERLHESAREMGSIIPFGQPILIGHHSEGRDRRYRARINSRYEKSFEANKLADDYVYKAAGVGTGGVSSDDPEALDKLREKLAGMEASQVLMVAANKIIRKFFAKRDLTDVEKLKTDLTATLPSLVALGLTEAQAMELFKPDSFGRRAYASYNLTNNSGNMKRVRERIAQLERVQATAAKIEAETGKTSTRLEFDGLTVEQNWEENRVLLFFPGKPSEPIRTACKRNGFRWSPTRGAWSRMNSNGALYAAGVVKTVWLAERAEKAQVQGAE